MYIHFPAIRTVTNLVLMGSLCTLMACSAKTTEPVQIEPSTKQTVKMESMEERPNYREYLPVWENDEERNLYDEMESRQILYFRREGCEDCERYESAILEQIEQTGVPYFILDVVKEPDDQVLGDYQIESKVVKSIGIKEVPTVAYVEDGYFLTRIENRFSETCEEVGMVAERLYGVTEDSLTSN